MMFRRRWNSLARHDHSPLQQGISSDSYFRFISMHQDDLPVGSEGPSTRPDSYLTRLEQQQQQQNNARGLTHFDSEGTLGSPSDAAAVKCDSTLRSGCEARKADPLRTPQSSARSIASSSSSLDRLATGSSSITSSDDSNAPGSTLVDILPPWKPAFDECDTQCHSPGSRTISVLSRVPMLEGASYDTESATLDAPFTVEAAATTPADPAAGTPKPTSTREGSTQPSPLLNEAQTAQVLWAKKVQYRGTASTVQRASLRASSILATARRESGEGSRGSQSSKHGPLVFLPAQIAHDKRWASSTTEIVSGKRSPVTSYFPPMPALSAASPVKDDLASPGRDGTVVVDRSVSLSSLLGPASSLESSTRALPLVLSCPSLHEPQSKQGDVQKQRSSLAMNISPNDSGDGWQDLLAQRESLSRRISELKQQRRNMQTVQRGVRTSSTETLHVPQSSQPSTAHKLSEPDKLSSKLISMLHDYNRVVRNACLDICEMAESRTDPGTEARMALMAPLDLPDESNLLPLRRPLTVHEARSIVGPLTLHLAHATLHHSLCIALHPTLTEEESKTVERLNEAVRRGCGGSMRKAVSWQSTLIMSLPTPNKHALLTQVLSKVHFNLSQLLCVVGMVDAPSQATQSIAVGYGRLKIAAEILWELVQLSRAPQHVDSFRADEGFAWEVCLWPVDTASGGQQRSDLLGLVSSRAQSHDDDCLTTVCALGLTGLDDREGVQCLELPRLQVVRPSHDHKTSSLVDRTE